MGAYRSADATVSAHGAFVVVPSDATDIQTTRGIYVGIGGNVAVTMADGQVVTYVGVVAGSVLPVQATRIMATNTTATTMLALY